MESLELNFWRNGNILATCAIDKKDLNLWSLWSQILGEIGIYGLVYIYIYISLYYIFLHFNSPSELSSRESTNLVGRLNNVLESVDAVEDILATYAIYKKYLNLWSLWS